MPNDSPGQQARAKLVAAILTDNGLEMTPPDDRPLDDIERERWAICVEIAARLGLDCDYVNPEGCGFRGTPDCCKYTPTQTTDCQSTATIYQRREDASIQKEQNHEET